VSNVEPNSAAAEAGLRPGDLLLEVNRQEVKSLEDYNKVLAGVDKKESILLLVKRGSHTRFVVLEPAQ
jgi:serine protease Do